MADAYRKNILISLLQTTTATPPMADKERKRKRDAVREERPHKRVALASTIKVSHLPKESIGPVIGEFSQHTAYNLRIPIQQPATSIQTTWLTDNHSIHTRLRYSQQYHL
jgi:hypothetical protein